MRISPPSIGRRCPPLRSSVIQGAGLPAHSASAGTPAGCLSRLKSTTAPLCTSNTRRRGKDGTMTACSSISTPWPMPGCARSKATTRMTTTTPSSQTPPATHRSSTATGRSNSSSAWRRRPPPNNTVAQDILSSFSNRNGVLTYRVFIQAKYLLPMKLEAGWCFGLGLYAANADRSGKVDSALTLASDGKGCYNKPHTWPAVLLVE